MIEILDSPEHVAAFKVTGTLRAEDYERVIPEIEERLEEHEEIGVLVDLSGLEDMTAGALREDIRYGLEKLGELHRFERAGIVSDKRWVEAVTEMAGALIPQIEARVFASGEKDEAMRWVSALR